MLSIVIVNFNSWDLLDKCLDTIPLAAGGHPYETIVVDNASQEDKSAELLARHPWIRFSRNEANLGFAAANNRGILASRGDYILLLNPDTEAEPGSFMELVRFLEMVPNAGIVGPKIYTPDGNLQYSCGRFPTLATEIIENFFIKMFPRHPLTGYYLYRHWDHATTRRVDWVTGACLLIRRQTIDRIGLLDESYFMYSEELDWCYRAKELDWLTFYYPKAVIIHLEGGSSRKAAHDIRFQSLVYRQYIKSSRLFFRKFYGRRSEFFLRVILLFSHYLRYFKASRRSRIPQLGNGNGRAAAKSLVFQTVIQDLSRKLDDHPV